MSGKRQKATVGGYNGAPPPLGYDYAGGAFMPNRDAATVQRIFAEFVEGRTLSTIAHGLNRDGRAPARGGRWHPATVRYVLNNGFYAGLAQYGETEVVGAHPALIAGELYDAAHARLLALRPGRHDDGGACSLRCAEGHSVITSDTSSSHTSVKRSASV